MHLMGLKAAGTIEKRKLHLGFRIYRLSNADYFDRWPSTTDVYFTYEKFDHSFLVRLLILTTTVIFEIDTVIEIKNDDGVIQCLFCVGNT